MNELRGGKLTQAKLKELMSYDHRSGILEWRKSRKGVKKGPAGGALHSQGYLKVRFSGRLYFYHRLVWLYFYGYFPEGFIDHINRNKTDNRIGNLREVSPQCNTRNSRVSRSNKSGVKGVCWNNLARKWQANIRVEYKNKHLGLYVHKHNAVCARLAAEQCLGWAGCDSSSPARQYVSKMLKENGYRIVRITNGSG